MSNLSHTIRKFDRFELKYPVPIKAAEAFKQSLRAYLVPDDHGDASRPASLHIFLTFPSRSLQKWRI